MGNATGIFKDHYEMSLKTMIILLSSYPNITYGEFSKYAYITFIIVINTKCHGEMQTKMLPAFLRKNSLQQLTIHPSPFPPNT